MEFLFVYAATYLFVALYCAVLFTRVNYDIGRQLEVRYFRLELAALFFYCIFEVLWALGYYGNMAFFKSISVPLSIVNHILVGCFSFFWFYYLESYLRSRIMNKQELQIVAAIPFFTSSLLTLSTLFNGLVFYTDETGFVQRGPAYIVTIALFYSYAVVTTFRSVTAAAHPENVSRRNELIAMSLFVLPPALIGVIDTIVPMMPIVAPAFFFAFLVVFTMLQEGQISTDQLTGLNNRRRADKHFDVMRANATLKKPYILLIIDVNSFKEINDTHGHLEGDNALSIVAASLRDACRNSSAFIARWGGDEFVIMTPEEDVNSAQDFVALIEDCLLYEVHEHNLPYMITVSIGYAYCTGPEASRKNLLDQADRVMYKMKEKYK